jgi:hypothetical protein
MEHIYKSIEIRNYLYSFFPLPDLAIELVINNLKLAVDLNGYTNEMLKKYIKQHKIVDLNQYLRKTYGKYRSNLGLLKRYQLIKVIQYFDILVPLKRYKIDFINQFQNNINITTENNIITIKVDDKVIELKPNTLINLNVLVKDNLYLYYKEIHKNKIYNYILVSKRSHTLSIICNVKSGPDITKIALLYYYTTIINTKINNLLDELYIEMKKIFLSMYDRCYALKQVDVNNGITISHNELQNIRNSLFD